MQLSSARAELTIFSSKALTTDPPQYYSKRIFITGKAGASVTKPAQSVPFGIATKVIYMGKTTVNMVGTCRGNRIFRDQDACALVSICKQKLKSNFS